MPVKVIEVPDVAATGVPRVNPPEGAAQAPSPRQNVEALADVPEFRFVTGKFPVTAVDKGIFDIVLLAPLIVLLVSVAVLVAVTTLLGVIIPDSATVAMIYSNACICADNA